jgi:hypothetical protein
LVLLLFAYWRPLAIHLDARSLLWVAIRVLQVNFLRLLSLRGLPQPELTSPSWELNPHPQSHSLPLISGPISAS